MSDQLRGADVVARCLELQGVQHVFGVPGAKIDALFDALVDTSPEVVVCRHEQNAAFMAAAVGRLTGQPGVCAVTSGPGASNLATGLLTADAEGDPVVALAGAVPRADRLKRSHQGMDTAAMFAPIISHSVEVEDGSELAEAIVGAFRAAAAGPGAAIVSLPADLMSAPASCTALGPFPPPPAGPAPSDAVAEAAQLLSRARCPIVLAGSGSVRGHAVGAIRRMLAATGLPVVETIQAAGLVSRELEDAFCGRLGLFHNQPGDELLGGADVVLAIGFDPIEYEPALWNRGQATLLHLDERRAEVANHYQPSVELVGDIASTVSLLREAVEPYEHEPPDELAASVRARLHASDQPPAAAQPGTVHPLHVIRELRDLIDDETTVACDVGSHYIWMSRHFRSYEPHRLLFSNGMQTLGVALPWAIATTLVRPGRKAVSVSGDGGFMFSSTELDTAVRLRSNLVHLVWRDGTYNMVAFQQQMKYHRTSGIDLGQPDVAAFAESFGATGMRVTSPGDLRETLERGLAASGPVVVDVPIDYGDNLELGATLHVDAFH